ncbi:MAG TPA: aldehyde dehydrogenase family protein [Polyangiaceae bacterium]|jgi:acyl-CoA reductase-like NAD-dependent aldehyde dehydrogenase|nr:aldehyde dehydrogenase family protein [Polyangiaceae bacterium]
MRIIDPATDQTLQELNEDTESTVRAKAAHSRAAQRGWAARPLSARIAILRRFRELVVERTDALALTLTSEVGKPIRQSHNELKGLLSRIDFFLERVAGELSPEIVQEEAGLEERISHEPLGLVANISAWNYPYFVGSNVFVPALLAGNAVLYKPSEFSTLTGLAIAQLLHEAGVPEAVFTPLIGGPAVGSALLDSGINGVFFTGSYPTGQAIAARVAPRLVKLQLELGGKDPVYVSDDVDVNGVAAGVADGAFYNTGQSCCSVERIYVHERIWDEFLARFVAEVQSFVLGDPRSESTYIGALARRQPALELLQAHTDDALSRGAKLELGGKRAARPGWFFEATVFSGADHSMRVMREESFGPIIGLMKVSSDEQALELMRDTEYGLTAAVYSRDRGRAERLLEQVDVGSAYWNCCDRVSPRLPWSGRKHSGIGATLSTYGIEAFLQPKAWHFRAPAG